METLASNKLIIDSSVGKSSSVFPQLAPFSPEDKRKVKTIIRQTALIWGGGLLITLVYFAWEGYAAWTDLLTGPLTFYYWGEAISYVFLSITLSAIVFYVIRKRLKDAKNGVKQVGLIEVLSKSTILRNNGGTTYLVHFKWLADPKEKEVSLSDSFLYDSLEEEDIVYLELLPLSKEILLFKKQESGINQVDA